jgi:hypothetical protein
MLVRRGASMRHRSPKLNWIKAVLADPEPSRGDLPTVVVINKGDEQRAKLSPDANPPDDKLPGTDLMTDLDTDLAEDVCEK